jgi:hypothetical protein
MSTEEQFYKHLSSVLDALDCIFGTDDSYTENNLISSLDYAREESEEGDDFNWHAFGDLCRAMQGRGVKDISDWGNLEYAAEVIKEATYCVLDYENQQHLSS